MAQTQTNSGTVVGYFDNQSDAQQAVEALRDAGFTSANVGMASRGGSNVSDSTLGGNTVGDKARNAAGEVGDKTEGMWDKVKNFFDGGDVEPYSDERADGNLATREITADPTAGGYNSPDLRGNLTGLSVPEDRSRYFDHRFQSSNNGTVVTVNAGSRSAEVEAMIKQYGGDLGENADTYDYSKTNNTNTDTREGVQGTQNIQLLGEILRVHKDRVSRGEVTIRKEVITENQTIQVPVTREELVIERHAVNGQTAVDGNIGDNSTIRIPLTEETASIDKSTVVREEVSVGKKVVENNRDLSGEVRHEELIVDDKTSNNR